MVFIDNKLGDLPAFSIARFFEIMSFFPFFKMPENRK